MSADLETLLLNEQVLEQPQDFYARLHAESPVLRAGDVYVASAYAVVAEAAKRVDDFSSHLKYMLYRDASGVPRRHAHGMGDIHILATADPPVHGAHRRLMLPSFTPGRLAALELQIAGQAERLIRAGLERDPVEFMGAVANRLPMDIVIALVGFRDSDPDALLKAAFASTDILAAAISLDTLKQRSAISVETGVWIAQQLQSAMQEKRGGILDDLAESTARGEIEPIVAIAILHILLSAGGESTTSLIGNCAHALASDQDLQRKLRADASLIPAFVEEMLRLETPFRYHMRWSPKQTTLGGTTIPEGATTLLMWGAANRDPATFERPNDIILERPRRHVAFGSGMHMCIGNPLARMEGRLVVQKLLELTSTIEHATRPAQRVPSLAVRRFETLPLVWRAAANTPASPTIK